MRSGSSDRRRGGRAPRDAAARTPEAVEGPAESAAESASAPSDSAARTGTKQARVLALLRQREGATIEAMMQATGWQPHTVRGFLSAVVRKKLGLAIVSEKVDGRCIHRITSDAAAASQSAA